MRAFHFKQAVLYSYSWKHFLFETCSVIALCTIFLMFLCGKQFKTRLFSLSNTLLLEYRPYSLRSQSNLTFISLFLHRILVGLVIFLINTTIKAKHCFCVIIVMKHVWRNIVYVSNLFLNQPEEKSRMSNRQKRNKL